MKLALGIAAGWATASTLMLLTLFVRYVTNTLREADDKGLHALATIQPITPDPHWADTLLDHILWDVELAAKDQP